MCRIICRSRNGCGWQLILRLYVLCEGLYQESHSIRGREIAQLHAHSPFLSSDRPRRMFYDPVLTRTILQISWATYMAISGRRWLTGSCKWFENQVGFGNVGSRSRARDCVIAWRSRRASILGHRDLLQKEVLTRTGVHKERACQKSACYMVFEEHSEAVLSMLIEFGSKTAFN